MEDLLPYYERELGIFRAYTREFAERFPKTAGKLLIAGETCEDPHIERLIQSFALLTARVAKRLDDDYPQLTEALLETLYPHYLRPFPSCSIARIDHSASRDRDGILRIPRGTVMQSLPVRGVKCRFTSAYEVVVAPIALTRAGFSPIIDAPPSLRLPDGAGAAIHLVIESTSPTVSLAAPPVSTLRLFADGEPSFRAALLDTLFLHGAGAYVEFDDSEARENGAGGAGGGSGGHGARGAASASGGTGSGGTGSGSGNTGGGGNTSGGGTGNTSGGTGSSGRWFPLDQVPLRPVGYAEEDALIPYSDRSHPAFRLLTEYFSFPEKFHFVDLDLAALAALLPPSCRRCTLHLPLRDLRSDSNAARLLAQLSANNLLGGCTPVVNLFAKSGVPVKLTQTGSDYPVLADATHAFGYEVHTITAARLIRQGGEAGADYHPLYASRHDDGGQDGQSAGRQRHYWLARRDDELAAVSPGHELRITLVDTDTDPGTGAGRQAGGQAGGQAGTPAGAAADGTANQHASRNAGRGNGNGATLSLELLCTNRDLPTSLRYGLPNGDLLSDIVPDGLTIRFLRKPGAPQRFAAGAGAHWRLISHLSLNYSGLTDAGLEEFRRMLCLYDLAQSPTSQRQINGIVGLQHGATRAWLPGKPFSTLMPGVRIRMRIDEQAFVGSGLFVFAQVMERYFGLNSQLNCFTQLDIVSHKTGEELIRCQARTAESTLT